jgi:hypothetical protein
LQQPHFLQQQTQQPIQHRRINRTIATKTIWCHKTQDSLVLICSLFFLPLVS